MRENSLGQNVALRKLLRMLVDMSGRKPADHLPMEYDPYCASFYAYPFGLQERPASELKEN